MMVSKRLILAAALLSSSSSIGSAAEFYIEGFLGGPIPREQRTDITGAGAATFTPGSGFALGGAVGVYLTPSIRADFAVLHGWNTGGSLTLDAVPGVAMPHAGRVSATFLTGNAYYEFLNDSRWTPWVGAGAGAVVYSYDKAGVMGAPISYNGTATAFTVAGHLGVDFALTDRVDVTGRYSLSYTGPHSIQSTPPGFKQTPRGGIDNSFLIGLRVKFGG